MLRRIFLAVVVLASSATLNTAFGSPVIPGDVVVYRVGDGAAALGTSAAAVFLDEYTPAGALVQSIPLPTTGATALTATGNSGTEGIVSRAQNGQSLVFAGYRANSG